LRLVIGAKLLYLVADGIIDPIRLRQLTVRELGLLIEVRQRAFDSVTTTVQSSPFAGSIDAIEGFRTCCAIIPCWSGGRSLPHGWSL
jgi:hypothetical protein